MEARVTHHVYVYLAIVLAALLLLLILTWPPQD
jgi:hypothetical protein